MSQLSFNRDWDFGAVHPLCCIGFLPIAAAARGWRLLRVLKRGRLEGGKKTRATVIA
jgi:hypothetical protein